MARDRRTAVGTPRELVADQRDVRGLEGDVRAGADRDPEVGLRQRRRVVDAVADHRDDRPGRLQLGDASRLVARQDLGQDPVGADADLGTDRLRHRASVAGDHPDLEVRRAQRRDRLGRSGLDRVGQADEPDDRSVPRHPGR